MTVTPHVLRDCGVSAVIAAFGGLHDGGAWALTEMTTAGDTEPYAYLTFTIGTKYDTTPVDERQQVTMHITVKTPEVKGKFDA